MRFLFSLFFVFCCVCCEDTSNYYVVRAPIEDTQTMKQTKQFDVYWNVPTKQCKSKRIPFEDLERFGIIQNNNDSFRGEKISILYDPGIFPALLKNESSGELIFRNGGVPQEGDLTRHIEMFKKVLNDSIPDTDFNGIGIIDFESWRPIYRQNFGVLVPYKDVSYDIERKRHWFWSKSMVLAEATRRFEEAAIFYMDMTLKVAKQMRPHAKWGYYAYPYCFNMAGKHMTEGCADNVRPENDKISWLWSESTALYPSLYPSKDHTTEQIIKMMRGRVKEAARVNKNNVPILPYFWYRYREGGFLTYKDLIASLDTLYKSNASGFIIWGSSSDVNTKEKCLDLLDYVNTVLGPAIAKFTKGLVKVSEDEYISTTTDYTVVPETTTEINYMTTENNTEKIENTEVEDHVKENSLINLVVNFLFKTKDLNDSYEETNITDFESRDNLNEDVICESGTDILNLNHGEIDSNNNSGMGILDNNIDRSNYRNQTTDDINSEPSEHVENLFTINVNDFIFDNDNKTNRLDNNQHEILSVNNETSKTTIDIIENNKRENVLNNKLDVSISKDLNETTVINKSGEKNLSNANTQAADEMKAEKLIPITITKTNGTKLLETNGTLSKYSNETEYTTGETRLKKYSEDTPTIVISNMNTEIHNIDIGNEDNSTNKLYEKTEVNTETINTSFINLSTQEMDTSNPTTEYNTTNFNNNYTNINNTYDKNLNEDLIKSEKETIRYLKNKQKYLIHINNDVNTFLINNNTINNNKEITEDTTEEHLINHSYSNNKNNEEVHKDVENYNSTEITLKNQSEILNNNKDIEDLDKSTLINKSTSANMKNDSETITKDSSTNLGKTKEISLIKDANKEYSNVNKQIEIIKSKENLEVLREVEKELLEAEMFRRTMGMNQVSSADRYNDLKNQKFFICAMYFYSVGKCLCYVFDHCVK